MKVKEKLFERQSDKHARSIAGSRHLRSVEIADKTFRPDSKRLLTPHEKIAARTINLLLNERPIRLYSVSAASAELFARQAQINPLRVFSKEYHITGELGGASGNTPEIAVFDALGQKDEFKNPLYVQRNGDDPTIRFRRVAGAGGWFEDEQPQRIFVSSDGMIPLASNVVILSQREAVVIDDNLMEMGGQADVWATRQLHMVVNQYRRGNPTHPQQYREFARMGEVLGMPRLSAYARHLIGKSAPKAP